MDRFGPGVRIPVMANAGTLTEKKGRICVGGENAGTDFAKEEARIFQGGVYVGADTMVENTELDDGITSIRKNFAKSMPGESWK